jgi:hypothetical protein
MKNASGFKKIGPLHIALKCKASSEWKVSLTLNEFQRKKLIEEVN